MFWKKPMLNNTIWVFEGECEVLQVHDRFVIRAAGSEMYWGSQARVMFSRVHRWEGWGAGIERAEEHGHIDYAIAKAEALENEYKRRHAVPVKVWGMKDEDDVLEK